MHTIGLVLHPKRDSAEAVEAVLGWAANNGAEILGIGDEYRAYRRAVPAWIPRVKPWTPEVARKQTT